MLIVFHKIRLKTVKCASKIKIVIMIVDDVAFYIIQQYIVVESEINSDR